MKIRHLMTLRMVSYILACICEGVRMYILAPYTSVHALRAILTPYTSVHALAGCENIRFHTKILAPHILAPYTSVHALRAFVHVGPCGVGVRIYCYTHIIPCCRIQETF